MLRPVDKGLSASGVIRLLAPSRDAHGGPEHHTEVVGRHCDRVLQRKAVSGGHSDDSLKIAYSPVRVAGPKLLVERLVAGGRVLALAPVGAVENEYARCGQETRGAGHQGRRG